jgi:hypothetical protein
MKKYLFLCMLPLAAMLYPTNHANAAMSRPCGWLTSDEISAALGAKVTAVEDRKNLMTEKPIGCTYKTADILKSVVLETFERPNPADAQQYFANITKQAARLPGPANVGKSAPITPVAGIGDQAVNVCDVLYVRKGAIVFDLTVFPGTTQTTTPESFKKAEALAKTALGRM